MNRRFFYAKILLFGEYSLMWGSRAITIPFRTFGGQLDFPDTATAHNRTHTEASNQMLHRYFEFLINYRTGNSANTTMNERQQAANPFSLYLNLDKLKEDLDQGLFFNSDIPVGYGIGSSGALVAALYDHYARTGKPQLNDIYPFELRFLKQFFAQMESFFHGQSSGIDPLSCFLGKALLLENTEAVRLIEIPAEQEDGKGGFFLIDTGMARNTSNLVTGFTEKAQQTWFNDFLKDTYVPTVDLAIRALAEARRDDLNELIFMISDYQLTHLNEMIPPGFISVWEKGLAGGEYLLKLCGAGGGGYLLGFTQDYTLAENVLPKIIPFRITCQ